MLHNFLPSLKGILKEALLWTAILIMRPFSGFRRPVQKRYLIPAYTGLGNFVLKTPFLRAIKLWDPEVELELLCGNRYGVEQVLREGKLIGRIHMLPTGTGTWDILKFYWRNRGRYDGIFLFFDTMHVFHLYLGSLLAAIPRRIGHYDEQFLLTDPKRKWCLTTAVAIQPKRHEVDLNFDLLEAYPIPYAPDYSQFVDVPAAEEPEFKRIHAELDRIPYITIQISAANGMPTPKVWPPHLMAELISMLQARNLNVVLLGDKGEQGIAEKVLAMSHGKPMSLVGKTSVSQTFSIIQRSACLVCHDSGLMHVANALNVPLVALFGPTDIHKNKPLGPRSTVLTAGLVCSPCMHFVGPWSEPEALQKCPITYRCMGLIEPIKVFHAILMTMQNRAQIKEDSNEYSRSNL